MLVYIDESGDPGMNFEKGSSRLFVVTAVTFQEERHAMEGSLRMNGLRKEAGLPEHVELHFYKSSHRVRTLVLNGIASCSFFYRSIVIDKTKVSTTLPRRDKGSFYEYAV